MTTRSAALEARRLAQENAAWTLLRSDNAAVTIAILSSHLGGSVRRLPAPVLFEAVDQDLEDLRQDFDLPGTGRAYCTRWRESGFLIRRAVDAAREETYELSDGALAAIRFVESLTDPGQSVTASRLATILDRIHNLMIDTDPDVTSRLAALTARRDAIEDEIQRVKQGDFQVPSSDQAVERALDILSLAAELPADFVRVRTDIEQINRGIRRQLIEETNSRGRVLDEVFLGIDHLGQSEAGRSFEGFYELITNAELSSRLDDDIDALLGRQFADDLPHGKANALQYLMPNLLNSSREIRQVMTALSRSLRRFVQSQEHQESRKVNQALAEAMQAAVAASAFVNPIRSIGLDLALTTVPMTSVTALTLNNPADSQTTTQVSRHDSEPVDLDRVWNLARASEIDFNELTSAVNQVLTTLGAATIGDVLAAHPATQGVASVIGLMVLGNRHARRLDGTELITWATGQGSKRWGRAPRYLFEERIS